MEATMTASNDDDHAGSDCLPMLYTELAEWWPLLSAPADYAEEAEIYKKTILEACSTQAETLLELGSGGGNNASHLRADFQMTLVDRSPEMIEVSRKLNPGCEHIEGDMRTVRLGREFDAVFTHDAIMYLTTEDDLRKAFETAFIHCRSGGAALFAPDHVTENFSAGTDHGGHNGDGRSLRYVEWTWDPDPNDNTHLVDFAYLLAEGSDNIQVVHDRHVCGLFNRKVWLRLLREAGFEPRILSFEHSELEPGSYEMFVGVKR